MGPWFEHQPLPTKTDRYSGAAELMVREGDQVTKPTPPPPRTERESRVAVSRVGVTLGKLTNRSELGQTDSRERRKIWCWLVGGVGGLFLRPLHQGDHSEDL